MEIAHKMPHDLVFALLIPFPFSYVFSIGAAGARSLQWWNRNFLFGVSRCGHLFAARRPQHEQSPVSIQKKNPVGLFKTMSERAWNRKSLFVNTQSYVKGISAWRDMISRMGWWWWWGDLRILMASPVNDFEQSSAGKVELGPRPFSSGSERATGHLQSQLASLSIQEGCSLVIFSY